MNWPTITKIDMAEAWACLVRRCPHVWTDCWWNFFGIAVEQRCAVCGSFRHHTIVDLPARMGDEPTWHDGKHPNNPTAGQP
mgnify:CR=1 FL=1